MADLHYGDRAQSRVAPLETFKRNRLMYHDCAVCKDPAPQAWFATRAGLARHIKLAHGK